MGNFLLGIIVGGFGGLIVNLIIYFIETYLKNKYGN